jgi:hypothetical protein
MDFNKLVHLARPTLKPNSVNAYATSLRVLAPDDATSLDFLLDSSKIIAQIEKFKHTTRRNYLNAVIVVLKGDEGQAENDTAIQKYEKERDKYNAEYSELVQSHSKTDRQKEMWIEWPDYLKIVQQLQSEVQHYKPGDWTKSMSALFQDYLIALLYSKYPLRNDFAHVNVITKGVFGGLTLAEKKKHNYLVKHKTNKYFLVLNEYKTSAKYGEKRIELDEVVLKPLRKWLRHNPTDTLLINGKGEPMTSNGITKSLARIGNRYRGKPFGSSILRHSYLSHKYADSVAKAKAEEKEKEEDADLMGHSVQMQEDYVKI